MDIVVWLRSLGLEEYEEAFRDNKIDERVLPNLTQEDLKEIGVGPVGHRRVLLDALQCDQCVDVGGRLRRHGGVAPRSIRFMSAVSATAMVTDRAILSA